MTYDSAGNKLIPDVLCEILDHITPACGQRRPPVVMTREEVRSVFARLDEPSESSSE